MAQKPTYAEVLRGHDDGERLKAEKTQVQNEILALEEKLSEKCTLLQHLEEKIKDIDASVVKRLEKERKKKGRI